MGALESSEKMPALDCRPADKAGSWYSHAPSTLDEELTGWLKDVSEHDMHMPAKAIISPHAGYFYSGHVAAFCFKQIDATKTKRIFILGPSHHVYVDGAGISPFKEYETPLGNLKLDTEIMEELLKQKHFTPISGSTDTDEHSIEMQLPYLRKVMGDHKCKIVPIMIGSVSTAKERSIGQTLAKYWADPGTVFVISSDFCHWGPRFRYTPYDEALGERGIHKSIENMDREGMRLIESKDLDSFKQYLEDSQNTICGRHPIAVLLAIVEAAKAKEHCDIKFLKYAQSNAVTNKRDSSVSYAAASLVLS
eukprot:Clim_evm31s225 gene=Clim_evmTU31s225